MKSTPARDNMFYPELKRAGAFDLSELRLNNPNKRHRNKIRRRHWKLIYDLNYFWKK